MQLTPDTTIRDIVAADFRSAAVFQKHGIDFCCKGDRPVAAACAELGLDAAMVLGEISVACAEAQPGAPRYAAWDLATLTSYIVGNHHSYVRQAIPQLLTHTGKVAKVHGERHPEMREVAELFEDVAREMHMHMEKEEQVLFPWIGRLVRAQQNAEAAAVPPFGSVANPISMMEMEHESAGDAMARIRELTNGYEPPQDACTTYRVCLQELQAFERDLHHHVHLENNILFPKALRLETETTGAAR